MADFSVPKISLDPAKIRDRWGLGAFGLVVWLAIAYGILMRPDFSKAMSVGILLLTFALLALVLMLSFSVREGTASASPNVPPARGLEVRNPKLSAQEIRYVAELLEFSKNPEVQNVLDEKFRKKRS